MEHFCRSRRKRDEEEAQKIEEAKKERKEKNDQNCLILYFLDSFVLFQIYKI